MPLAVRALVIAGSDTLLTVTTTGMLVPTLPAASYASVMRVCVPFVPLAVFHVQEYGEVMSVV